MTTPRERNHAATTRTILDAARVQLAEVGAAALSLRAVAREVGMVSSAVYRYVPSRDELLTRLIVEAYDALGAAAEEARDPARPPRDQWRAVWRAVRAWALTHPAEYALLYGSPVPGYAAPRDTVVPAERVARTLVAIVVEHGDPVDGPARLVSLEAVPELDAGVAPAAVMAWTQLFGAVSFELAGQYENVVLDREGFLDHLADVTATAVGLA